MANIEKLIKAFESLKVLQPDPNTSEDLNISKGKKEVVISKKEKTSSCNIIADCISSANLRNAPDFPKFLGVAIETFLVLCDDAESDVRIVADECLNRTIKTLIESNLGRLQVELYKEVKKNGSSRSLRAALWRFADLCHLIRPQKCRPYVVNLLPCLSRICRRNEESVQETLSTAMHKICPVLIGFTTDIEAKMLLKSFLPNIRSPSVTMRRTAALSLTLICQHSRKPATFSVWLLNVLLDSVIPLEEMTDVSTILGMLLSLRHLLSHLMSKWQSHDSGQQQMKGSFGAKFSESDAKLDVRQLVKVLELLLFYTSHSDHNVVTAALEALHQLLKNAPLHLLQVLVTSGGVANVNIQEKPEPALRSDGHSRLPSVGEEASGLDDEVEPTSESVSTSEESEDALQILSEGDPLAPVEDVVEEAFDPPADGDRNGAKAEQTDSESGVIAVTTRTLTADADYSAVAISNMKDGVLSQSSSNDTLSSVAQLPSPEHSQSNLLAGTDHPASSANLSSRPDDLGLIGAGTSLPGLPIAATLDTMAEGIPADSAGNGSWLVREGDFGDLNDTLEVPLVYLVRLLCKQFLLTGYQYGLVSDRRVRVSVKALALSCVSYILELYPKAFLAKLHKSSPEPGELQDIRDILRYVSHSDPQLKGNTAIVIGHLLRAVLTEGRGSFDKWVQSSGLLLLTKDSCILSDLVTPLISILEDENSVAARCALTSLQLCLPSLLNSNHSDVGLSIILTLLQLKDNTYWLVKVELLELLALIDYKTVFYLESSCTPLKKDTHHPYLRNLDIQDHVLTDVILVLLGDEDFRVRHAAAVALCGMIPKLFFEIDNPLQDPVAAKAKESTMVLLNTVMDDWASKIPTTATLPHGSSTVRPFDQVLTNLLPPADCSATTESALSRVLTMVVRHLIQSVCRRITLGCCHALCLLSEQYPVGQYANAWGCCPFASVGLLSSSSLSSSSGGTIQNKKSFRSLSSSGNGSLTSSVGSILSPLGCLEDLSMATGGGGSLPLFLSILTSSPVALDLSAQADALKFVGNLFTGAAYKCLRCPAPDGSSQNAEDMRWSALADRWLVPVADQLLTHVARLLNICFHVIEERVPGPPQTKPSLPSLPTAPSLSPIKRKAKSMKEDASSGSPSAAAAATASEKTGSATSAAAAAGGKTGSAREAEKEKGRKEGGGLGVFYSQQHYVKLYEVLRGAYSNYKISLDLMNSEKFVHVLSVVLQVLSQMLEVASLADVGKYAEELLGYLRSTITVEATASVLCVQQLLKAIFGTNVSGQWDSADQNSSRGGFSKNRPAARATTRVAMSLKQGIYHSCLNSPYTQFTQSLAGATFRANVHSSDQEEAVGFISWLKKKAEKKSSGVIKLAGRTDKTSVASYIRLFEPLVIKALKQYTITSQVSLQQQVLDLLAHLVQLRVNYCLLDSDQIFIGYVIKQIEYIEEGQIRNSDQLISHMFNFLILLSYERYHSKTIIMMPKIIQLCDGIMASGLDPTTHAIPSLQCIVNDLFIVRAMNKSDAGKDLETQREVVISMLLRLLQHYQMLELFIVILHQCRKEGEDRWKRLSRQVTDLILPLLAKQQVNLDSQVALDIVHRLFENVAPSVFRPVDILLKVLLAKPEDFSTMQGLQRWVGLVLVTLRVVMAQSKEEVVLSRLQELGLSMSIYKDDDAIRQHHHLYDVGSTETMKRHSSRSNDLNEEESNAAAAGASGAICSAEETVARFLLQVVGVVVSEIKTHSATMVTAKVSSDFLSQELAHLLLYITHMFQSGIYRRVAMVAMAMIRRDAEEHYYSIQEINESFRSISSQHPTLMLQWSNVLILLNYDDQAWWSRVLRTPRTYMVASSASLSSSTRDRLTEREERLQRHCTGTCKSINREIVRSGGLILLCDYVCENLTDAEHMTWIIINHVYDLIRLSLEPPVQDFVSAIHRNSAASGLFIQAIHSRCEHLNLLSPSVVKKMLKCLEAIHLSQTGSLLSLLIEKFLNTHHLAIARICDAIACRRVEMLLAENQQENVNQMTSDDLEKVIQFMKTNALTRRHCRLATLLSKLQTIVVSGDQHPPPPSVPLLIPTNASPLSTLATVNFTNQFQLNKDWFLSFVQEQCFAERAVAKDCAQFLQHLDYTGILNIIMSEECNISILEECVSLGTKRTLESSRRPLSVDRLSSPTRAGQPAERTVDALLQASQMTVFRHINNIINMLPMPHEVVNFDAKSMPAEDQYREKMEELFTDSNWHDSVYHLSKAMLQYLTSLKLLPWRKDIPEESVKDIGRFATLFLEALHWLLEHGHYPSSDQLLTGIHCYTCVLQNDQLAAMMERREQTTMLCSAIRMVHSLLCSFLVLPGDSLVKLPDQENKEELPNCGFDDLHLAIRACDQISELVHSLTTHLQADSCCCRVPQYLVNPLRRLIIVLARMPLVNSYARTPPLVWKIGTWMPSPSGDIKTKLPPLPLNFLQEKDVLSDFIVRVNLLGWTSRQQFEETWMSLLGVLNPVTLGPEHPLSPEEIVDRTQCQILATRGITSLLLLSTLTPVSGNPGNSNYDHRPREKPPAFLSTRLGMKLVAVRSIVERELMSLMKQQQQQQPDEERQAVATTSVDPSVNHPNMLIGNIERELRADGYHLAQFSVESLWSLVGLLDVNQAAAMTSESGSETTETSSSIDSPSSAPPPLPAVRSSAAQSGLKQERSSRLSGLDIHSCLQFLLELYEALLSPLASPRTPLVLLNETLRSVVILSDVFTDRAQFEWMLGMLLQVQKSHPAEDELVSHYVVLGVCKSAAVIGADANVMEHIVKLIDTSLKSTHLPTKLAALYGSLYLLEAGLTDGARQIIPILTEYVLKSLGSMTAMTIHSQQHVLVMWSLAFYIRENFLEEVKDSDFAARMFQLCISLVSVPQEPTPLSIYLAILRGLERLLLTKTLAQKDVDALIKLSIDRLCQPSPQRSFAALGLLLTCMYTGHDSQMTKRPADGQGRKALAPSQDDDAKNGEEEELEEEEDEQEIIVLDTESLIIAMERVTVLFDRIRKGLPSEARVITNILPSFLMDFFPAQDIMNKVIGEFLYSQQPHPQLMAKVVFQVFNCLIGSNQQSLVKNWVMLSLSNFTQRTPLSMAIWIQTCFFISASGNQWLKALFPHVIGRMGKLEVADQRLFFIAALDFHHQLTLDDGHLRTFQATFQSVAQTEPIYAELLSLCSLSSPSSSTSAAATAEATSSQ